MNQFALVDCYSIYQTLKNKRKTDGIAIYVKSALTHEKEEIKLTDCNCYVVRIIKDNRKFTCISFYRSPNGKIDIFLQELKTVLQKYQDNNETNFIIGDMNIDTSISGNRSAKVEEYLHLLAEYGYICLVNKPTRVAKNSATCIDHIFSQFKEMKFMYLTSFKPTSQTIFQLPSLFKLIALRKLTMYINIKK